MKPPSQLPHIHLPQPSLKHPGRWIWLIVLVPVILGLLRLHFDVEVFDLLPSDLPAVEGLKVYQQYFANARELLLTVKAPTAEQAENSARAIAEQLRPHTNLVAGVTWEPPWLEHPDQAAELMAYLWFNQPPPAFATLANRLAPTNLDTILATTREELTTSMSPQDIALLSYDPFGLTRLPESAAGAAPSFAQGQETFSSADGTFRIIFVQARPVLRSYPECAQWLAQVKALVHRAVAVGAPPAVEGGSLPPSPAFEQSNVPSVRTPNPGETPGATAVTVGYTGRPAFVAEVATEMQHDMQVSVGGTAVIIAILFWLAHRRVKPMLWLLVLLAAVLGSTLALGGLIFGTINVVSMGFAAILLGLAVDYAVVHYQEALAHPNLTVPQIRHAIAPSIFWAAVTTISAFLVLNFGGLPGLGQLGTLVGLGVALAATIMIFEFLPPLFPGRNEAQTNLPARPQPESPPRPRFFGFFEGEDEYERTFGTKLVFALTAVAVVFALVVLAFGLPPIDSTANALRPRHSPAYATLDEIQAHLNQKREPVWVIVSGPTITNVAQRLDQVQSTLAGAVSSGLIAGFTLPAPLWPHPTYQEENRATARQLAAEGPAFRQAAATNGFAERSLALTERVLQTWQTASATPSVFWPTNTMSQWIFQRFAARTPTNYLAVGLINPATTNGAAAVRLAKLESQLPSEGVLLSGWELLGSAIFARVKANLWKVITPMVILVLLSLYLAFRRPPEILLSLGGLVLSLLLLLSIMRLVGWSWNLLNLMAIPLVLGTGVDYSLFMQLALRRYHGDLGVAYRSVGRALLLCGGTAVAGFGSLALSNNAGMASLGKVCAVGIGTNMLIAIFLLPRWWQTVTQRAQTTGHNP